MEPVEGLSFAREGAVATLTLNRPDRLNAITWRMVEGLADYVEECGRDDSVRAIVITGAGRAFSSGDDIVSGMGEIPARHGVPASISTDLGLHHLLVKTLLSTPKPVVAALNGRCHGAGWVTALACDFRVARADALIGDIRSGKAIFAGQGVPLMLPRLIGQSRAMDLLITGRVLDAAEAERYGIVTRVWPVESYGEELSRFVDELANGPTRTYAAWKLTVNRSILQELDAFTDYERRIAALARQTDDAKEGVLAFREKRPPRFTGR
jgi:2-(1,2-epoxy-1,2-dihydrophenyl)acetyl-CoA isomerase